jgi:hypothetical protein
MNIESNSPPRRLWESLTSCVAVDRELRGMELKFLGSVTGTTSVQTILITVLPHADGIVPAPPSEGDEDNGTVAFGAVLANATTGIGVVDDGTPVGTNNNATETISRIQIEVPLIRQPFISGASNLALLTPALQASAKQDIRSTLATFLVRIGPTHTDTNGAIYVIVSTLDVNIGEDSTLVNAAFYPYNPYPSRC